MEQSKLLMDYTKFHIGVYITLGGTALGLGKANLIGWGWLLPTLVLLVIAGICGGTIARYIPEFKTFDSFKSKPIGLLKCCGWTYKTWARWEHISFWLAILWGAFAMYMSVE